MPLVPIPVLAFFCDYLACMGFRDAVANATAYAARLWHNTRAWPGDPADVSALLVSKCQYLS